MDKPSDHSGHRQRLRRRFELLENSGQKLDDCELMELLLTYAIPRRDVAPAAEELIKRYGSVQNALSAPQKELASVPGISDPTALFLKLVGSVKGGKPSAAPRTEALRLPSLAAAAEHCRRLFEGMGEELLLQVLIGEDSGVISSCFISCGGRDSVALPVGMIINNARMANARGVVLAHNHPSGDVRPSQEDVEATRRAAKLMQKNGVRLYEHFIVADGRCRAMLKETEINE